ncbi:MAG TPA: LysR substrate-binding domain-containing protein, partial [Burkholderiaceae bacterium]
ISIDILQGAAFDPARAERAFTLLTPDIGEVTFIPPVLACLRTQAPMITLRALSLARGAAAEALESGAADLAVGFFPDLKKAGIFQQRLFKTSYQCIACASLKSKARLTMKEFLAARHVVVRPDGREHSVDRFLEEKGHARRVVLEVSHFMSLLAILPGSDLVATVPDDIAAVVARHIPIRKLELPFRPPVIDVQQSWHRRMQQDPAHMWLRALFYQLHRRQ